jgi:hypothetical protein
VELAAGQTGLSVNARLVRIVAATLDSAATPSARPARPCGGHLSGWVR